MIIALFVFAYLVIGCATGCVYVYQNPVPLKPASGKKEDEGDFGFLVFCLVGWPIGLPLVLLETLTERVREAGMANLASKKAQEKATAEREAEIERIIKENAL